MNRFNKKLRGFTLLELVAVMVVVGILLLLAGPNTVEHIGQVGRSEIVNSVSSVKHNFMLHKIENKGILPEGSYFVAVEDVLDYAMNERVYTENGLVSSLDENSNYVDITGTEIVEKSRVNLDGLFVVDDFDNVYYIDASGPFGALPTPIDVSCFEYENVENEIIITGYNSFDDYGKACSKNVIIPEEIEGYPVIGIDQRTFEYASMGQIASLGSDMPMFRNDEWGRIQGIESIVIPDTIRFIGDEAFAGNNLIEIFIPESVEAIGVNPFSGNKTLVDISVDEHNAFFKDFKNGLYSKDGKSLILGTVESSVNILPGVETIKSSAFKGMNLSSISLPEGVKNIEAEAFADNNIDSFIVPPSMENINQTAFTNNGKDSNSEGFPVVSQVTGDWKLSQGKWVNYDLFNYAIVGSEISIVGYSGSDTKDLIVPAEINGMPVKSIESWAFANNVFETVIIESGIQEIAMHAFRNNKITSVTIPSSVVQVGNHAFKDNGSTQKSDSLPKNGPWAGIWIIDDNSWNLQ